MSKWRYHARSYAEGKKKEKEEENQVMPGAPSIDPVKAAQAMGLADLGYTQPQIAEQTGISQRSISDILRGHGRWGEVAEKPVFARLRLEQNQVLESAFRAGSAKLFERAFEENKLKKASTYQLVIASSIAIDKARLLAGEPTEITASVNLHAIGSLDQLASKLSQVLLKRSQTGSESNHVLTEESKADDPDNLK